ncbi:MAG: transport permease protein [Gammaproteobacteria bacterium]|nr:MAG: transport permease protein [Gammaproteobacteria bacterium]
MDARRQWIALCTLVRREVRRFMRIWTQTLLPPVITTTLYYLIFGALIGPRIGPMGGVPYIQYIAPGLIMMSVITNAYSNVVSSFYGAKFQRNIDEMLVSPMPNAIIVLGFVIGGIARALCVGAAVTVVSLLFTDLTIHHLAVVVSTAVLTAALFSLAGLVNAIFANSFDDINIVPTFVLTPLIYLGGVFYSIEVLPAFWRSVSLFNPMLYMVNVFRYGVLGVSDVQVVGAYAVMAGITAVLFLLNLYLLERSSSLRS